MDAPGARVDRLRQRVDVRPLQLVELAIRTDDLRQLVLLRQLFEDRCVRRPSALRRALQDGQVQFVEEDLLELIARSHREVAPREDLRLPFDPRQILLDPFPEDLQHLHVHEHAEALHVREHARQR